MGRLHLFIGDVCVGQQLFLLNADGSGLRQLTQGEGNFNVRPVWSPDGNTIAYMSGPSPDEARKADIFFMQADGSNPQALTHGGSKEVNCDPAWSPDGSEIAFCSNRSGSYELYIMNRNGTNLRQITYSLPDGVRHPSWSPDGRRIVFATAKAWRIYLVNVDGTNMTVLSRAGWHPVFGKVPGS
jgi:Tol biopolymer transport system component